MFSCLHKLPLQSPCLTRLSFNVSTLCVAGFRKGDPVAFSYVSIGTESKQLMFILTRLRLRQIINSG